jgi:hypothetical protein
MGSTKSIAKCLEAMMQNALVTKEEQDFCPGKCRERDIFVGDGVQQVLAESSITMCHD